MARLSWLGRLVTQRDGTPTTNRAEWRATWLTETSAFSLHQIRLCESLSVVAAVMHGSECWCKLKKMKGEYSRDDELAKKNERSNQKRLIRNEVIRDKLKHKQTVLHRIKKKRLNWFGHVTCPGWMTAARALNYHVQGERNKGRIPKSGLRTSNKMSGIWDMTRNRCSNRLSQVQTFCVTTSSSTAGADGRENNNNRIPVM